MVPFQINVLNVMSEEQSRQTTCQHVHEREIPPKSMRVFFWGGQVRQNRYCLLWVNMHGCSCKLSTCTGTLCSKQLPNSQATSPKLFDAEYWAVKLNLPTTSEDLTSTHKLGVVFRWRFFFFVKLFFCFSRLFPAMGKPVAGVDGAWQCPGFGVPRANIC